MDAKKLNTMKDLLFECGTEENNEEQRIFEEYVVHRVCQHPLKKIIEVTDIPCLLLSRHIQNCIETKPCTPIKSRLQSNPDESYEGSPLKLQEFHTENFVTTSIESESGPVHVVRPLSAKEARSLLSLYAICSNKTCNKQLNKNYGNISNNNVIKNDEELEQVPSVWVLCDGKDPDKHVMMGMQTFTHQNKTCFVSTNVTVHSPVFQDSKVIQQLWLKRPPFCRSKKDLSTKCFAKYSIHSSIPSDETLSSDHHQGSLEVQYQWNRMTSLLQSPPVEAKAVLKVKVTVGDSRSAAHVIYTDLSVLQGLVQGLESGLAQWSAETESALLQQRVQKLVHDQQGGSTPAESRDHKPTDDTVFLQAAHNLFINPRDELDFTEQLWNILKDCSSLNDLITSLKFILHQLQSGDLQPVINRDNQSAFAQLIRNSYYGQMVMPDLEGTLPLELLVEIGIEKMCNDYCHIFLEKELVTMDSLAKFTERQVSLAERVEGLNKLQHVLELQAMLDHLLLPKVTLSISARHALKYYETNTASNSHTFSLPVSTTSIKIDRFQPSLWQAEFTSQEGHEQMRALYLFTDKSPFEHVSMSVPDTTILEETNPYYFTCLVQDVTVV